MIKRARNALNTLPSSQELGHFCCNLADVEVSKFFHPLNAKDTLPLSLITVTHLTSFWVFGPQISGGFLLSPGREYNPISWLWGARPSLADSLLTLVGMSPNALCFFPEPISLAFVLVVFST